HERLPVRRRGASARPPGRGHCGRRTPRRRGEGPGTGRLRHPLPRQHAGRGRAHRMGEGEHGRLQGPRVRLRRRDAHDRDRQDPHDRPHRPAPHAHPSPRSLITPMDTAPRTLLIANRGEIAVRIIRTAQARGLRAVAVRSTDEEALGAAAGLHVQLADEVVTLPGRGAAAYPDAEAVVAAAQEAGAQLVHPGYGFLAESAQLAELCTEAGLTWVGPSPEALALFGDKRATRQRAVELGVPVPAATDLLEMADQSSALAAVRQLLAEHPDGIAIKAVAGGGGRGIRFA